MTIGKRIVVVVVLVLAAAAITAGCLGNRIIPDTTPAPPAIFLDYHRTGGIAGFDDRLIIFENGAGLLSTRAINREIQVNASERARISRLFETAGFDALQGTYTSRRGGADLMHYSITYRGKTVMTEDTAVPDTLEPILQEMNAFLSSGMIRDLNTGSLAGIRN